MGNTFTIEVWTLFGNGDCEYVEFYCGESLIAALWNLFAAKRQGYGCVKFEWR